MMKYIILLLSVFIVTGCTTKTPPVTITKTEYILISPPESRLVCEELPALLEEPFGNVDVAQYIRQLYGVARDCNITMKELNSWIKNEQERVSQLNKK